MKTKTLLLTIFIILFGFPSVGNSQLITPKVTGYNCFINDCTISFQQTEIDFFGLDYDRWYVHVVCLTPNGTRETVTTGTGVFEGRIC